MVLKGGLKFLPFPCVSLHKVSSFAFYDVLPHQKPKAIEPPDHGLEKLRRKMRHLTKLTLLKCFVNVTKNRLLSCDLLLTRCPHSAIMPVLGCALIPRPRFHCTLTFNQAMLCVLRVHLILCFSYSFSFALIFFSTQHLRNI